MTAPCFPRGLYGITPQWDDIDRLLDAVRAATRGGMRALQWRHKTASPIDLPLSQPRREQAHAVVQLCRELGVVSIINDDWRLAIEINADGVHLGRDDGDIAVVRQNLGSTKLLGVSCYDEIERARAASIAGADYVAFGAIYPSPTKPTAVHAPLARLTEARALLRPTLPGPRPAVVAIGGITPANAGPVVAAGADAIALISGLFEADDIESAAHRCAALFTRQTG